MDISFLSPEGGLIALLVVAPLAGLLVVSRRSRRAREVLRLPDPERPSWVLPAAALVTVTGLLALAAAQPVISDATITSTRDDVEAIIVIDNSLSMSAAAGPGEESRFDRARGAAVRLRSAIPEVPVGVASLTDRALPHLFPSTDHDAFREVLDRSVQIDQPPPLEFNPRSTIYEPIGDLVARNYFSEGLQRRVIVVLSDGEARPSSAQSLAGTLSIGPPTEVMFVRFWEANESIFLAVGSPDTDYVPDPGSESQLRAFASGLSAAVFDEEEEAAQAEALDAAVGEGPKFPRRERGEPFVLTPYLAGVALLPLLFLLWVRNRA
jgi:von Willebrand factor type A domain